MTLPSPSPPAADRFGPRAVRELSGMFDDVSGRYDLLNRLMSLGQDRAWRAAMCRAVPQEARVVLDLCTGSGVSLTALRRPGRLVLGVDVSLRMLEMAAGGQGRAGWAPRLVAADAFRLPLADRTLDAVTIAFGIRNLRPTAQALAELARVLRPGGTLAVLEATAPAPGPLAPLHGFYLRHLVPLAGRLSPDPSAYQYLSCSIFEFGVGPEFERALEAAGFQVVARRRFLLGAARLWVSRRTDQNPPPSGAQEVQNARPDGALRVNRPIPEDDHAAEWRIWTGAQLALALALTATLAYGLWLLLTSGRAWPLPAAYRPLAWVLLVGGLVLFAARSVQLLLRFLGPPPRP